MHKYYDWQLIENLPLSALGELLSFAFSEEEKHSKLEIEKQLFPLWIANYIVAKLQGAEEIIDFEEFINQALKPGVPAPKKPKEQKRSAEDIMAEFMPLVEADRRKGG